MNHDALSLRDLSCGCVSRALIRRWALNSQWNEFPGLHSNVREVAMLWTIFVILLVLWLLGVVTSYTLGGFIHVLLVIAVIMAVMQLIQGRRAL
jgi:hypothetical protein